MTRTAFFLTELALESTAGDGAALRPRLRDSVGAEGAWLGSVYNSALYGGATLGDSLADGAHDAGGGSLFTRCVGAACFGWLCSVSSVWALGGLGGLATVWDIRCSAGLHAGCAQHAHVVRSVFAHGRPVRDARHWLLMQLFCC